MSKYECFVDYGGSTHLKILKRFPGNCSGNFSLNFRERRAAAAAAAEKNCNLLEPSLNPHQVWADFKRMPCQTKLTFPPFLLGNTIKVIPDLYNVTYPVDFLPFYFGTEEEVLQYEHEMKIMNTVYQALAEVTTNHVMDSELLVRGNTVVVYQHEEYKRAVVLNTLPEVEGIQPRVRVYLVDEGIEAIVVCAWTYRTVSTFWKLRPLIMKCTLVGFTNYKNTTEYLQFLKQELQVDTIGIEFRAEIVEQTRGDSYKILLYSSRYPHGLTLNEIILKKLFTVFLPQTILANHDFLPVVYCVSANKNGEVMLNLDTPVVSHLQQLLKEKLVEAIDEVSAAQEKTNGVIEVGQHYIYRENESTHCYRVMCKKSTATSKYAVVDFIDFGSKKSVDKSKLAHIDIFKCKKTHVNFFTLIPPQVVRAHLAKIGSMDLAKFSVNFANERSFSLRKREQHPPGSRSSVEIELFIRKKEKNNPFAHYASLNNLILGTGIGTRIKTKTLLTLANNGFSSLSPIEMDGAHWGGPDEPLVKLEVGAMVNITILGDAGTRKLFVCPTYARNKSLIVACNEGSQSYLADDIRFEEWCGCLWDGYDFAVEKEFVCSGFHRIKLVDRVLWPIEEPTKSRPLDAIDKEVECLFVDRGEYARVRVGDLRRLNPEITILPAQGALAEWVCDEGYAWTKQDWEAFLAYALPEEVQGKTLPHQSNFRAKVLEVKKDKCGRSEFKMNLCMDNRVNNTEEIPLHPQLRFWEKTDYKLTGISDT